LEERLHPFIALAHKAVKTYLESGQIISAPVPLPTEMSLPAAVFVSIYAANNQLRGCRGTITPTEPNLAEAIIQIAIASATDDPRFPPITLSEVSDIKIKIDVLSPLEPVKDVSNLDEKVYGVMIQSGQKRAVLLPNIAAVDSVPRQIELVRKKARISPTETANLYRFTVTRYEEDS
jgi:AmmeMemoRadiSam system protein A